MKVALPASDAAYGELLREIKSCVHSARLGAARAVNRAQLALYWELGRLIAERQEVQGWGQSVVERLSADLRAAFPDMTGFSPQNLWLMRQLFTEYRAQPNLQQLVGEIPWGQNLLIMQRAKHPEARRYYLETTARLGWTRNVLLNQIKADAYGASLQDKTHNFPAALPEYLAEQADEALKSRYSLEFLGIRQQLHERDLERRLLAQLKDFMVELGYGFCFVGSQYRLTLGDNEYFLDLLFYHRFLKCLVAVELKTGRFRPEYAGKMDFYLDLLNETEKATDDNPSIGIILCAEKDRLEVEFSLKSKANPIGVAEYQLCALPPEELRRRLPSEADWQRLLARAAVADREAGEVRQTPDGEPEPGMNQEEHQ